MHMYTRTHARTHASTTQAVLNSNSPSQTESASDCTENKSGNNTLWMPGKASWVKQVVQKLFVRVLQISKHASAQYATEWPDGLSQNATRPKHSNCSLSLSPPHPSVLMKPQLSPSAYREMVSPMWRKEDDRSASMELMSEK